MECASRYCQGGYALCTDLGQVSVTLGLGGASGVKRALDALIAKELVCAETDENRQTYFAVYDVFLSRWLEMN